MVKSQRKRPDPQYSCLVPNCVDVYSMSGDGLFRVSVCSTSIIELASWQLVAPDVA